MNDFLIYLHNTMVAMNVTEIHIVGLPLLLLSVMAWNSYKDGERKKDAEVVPSTSSAKE